VQHILGDAQLPRMKRGSMPVNIALPVVVNDAALA
jgi:hypothetical protein